MRSSIGILGMATALFSAILLVLSGAGHRFEIWSFKIGIQLFIAAGVTGLAGVILIAITLILQRSNLSGGQILLAGAGLALSVASLFVTLHWKNVAYGVPRIHDISTDTLLPPEFIAALPLRAKALNPVKYGGPEIAAQQHRAYPDIQPRKLKMPQDQAFKKALEAANAMRWKIVAADSESGRIEATATTFWFGFKDDVVIRVSPQGDNSRVDIRSVSRVGISDLGANAGRIREFFGRLEKITG